MITRKDLPDHESWLTFLQYKKEYGHLTGSEEKALSSFIEAKDYEAVYERMLRGEAFPSPVMKKIRKTGSSKKRTVFLFPEAESNVLKLMTFQLLRKYDFLFEDNLYSFRINLGVAAAMKRLLRTPHLDEKYTYKADIHDYFNSIPTERLTELVTQKLSGDPALGQLLRDILTDPYVWEDGTKTVVPKGAMAGTPFAVFLANLYLLDMDKAAKAKGLEYYRYSDDILILAEDEAAQQKAADFVRGELEAHGLSLNPDKEFYSAPGEGFSFLGIRYCRGEVDIADVSMEKLKAKIRRRARAIKRWQVRKKTGGEQAAKALIKAVNRKFFAPDSGHELTWSRWYFPVINTDKSLKELDAYVQDWLRYLVEGSHGKDRFRCSYDQIKQLGYISLVHAWYDFLHTDKP